MQMLFREGRGEAAVLKAQVLLVAQQATRAVQVQHRCLTCIMCVVLQVEAIKSRVGALYTFGQPRVGDYEVRGGVGLGGIVMAAAIQPQWHRQAVEQCSYFTPAMHAFSNLLCSAGIVLIKALPGVPLPAASGLLSVRPCSSCATCRSACWSPPRLQMPRMGPLPHTPQATRQ